MTTTRHRLAVIGLRGVPDVIGGIETHCALLYPALARQVPQLDITLLVRRRYVRARRYQFEGVQVRALRSPAGAAWETLLHSGWALLYARFVLGARIVHLHGIGPGFFTPLARLIGLRIVVTDHANDFERPKWGRLGRTFLRWGERLAVRFADRLICVSHALALDLMDRRPSAALKLTVIPHGVRLADAAPEGDEKRLSALGLLPGQYILSVGRLEHTKRVEDVVAARVRLGSEALPLVIVGASIGNDHYERFLRSIAGPSVMFVGFQSGAMLTTLYRRAALLVHASAMEGFGLVVLEALDSGAAVATSDISVHREFGLPATQYFPTGDVDQIARLIAATSPRHAPWPPAAEIARRYSLARSVGAHAALFRDLLGLTADHRR